MMGFHKDADLEEWGRKFLKSWEKQELIPEWRDFIKICPTNIGDLFLIPSGITHGHGGNQMVLELDISASS